MSILAFGVVNFILAAVVLAVILRLHVWAIRTAHRDHVPAAKPAPVTAGGDQRPEVLPEDVAIAV